jgi:hypothetical protein
MHRLWTTVSVACTIALLATAPNAAAQARPVADCNAHGQLTQTYSAQQLKGALATMPATIKEYTNCYDVIQTQLLNQLGGAKDAGGGKDSGSGSSFLPVPVIILLAVLLIAAGGYAALAVRRRGSGGGGPDDS